MADWVGAAHDRTKASRAASSVEAFLAVMCNDGWVLPSAAHSTPSDNSSGFVMVNMTV